MTAPQYLLSMSCRLLFHTLVQPLSFSWLAVCPFASPWALSYPFFNCKQIFLKCKPSSNLSLLKIIISLPRALKITKLSSSVVMNHIPLISSLLEFDNLCHLEAFPCSVAPPWNYPTTLLLGKALSHSLTFGCETTSYTLHEVCVRIPVSCFHSFLPFCSNYLWFVISDCFLISPTKL